MSISAPGAQPILAVTQYNKNSATAPGAFGQIAVLPVLPAGLWRLAGLIGFGATAEATTVDNFGLFLGGTSLVHNLSCPLLAANTEIPFGPFLFNSDGINAFTIFNIAAASAGAVYKAALWTL